MTLGCPEWIQMELSKVVVYTLQNDITNPTNTMNLFWNPVRNLLVVRLVIDYEIEITIIPYHYGYFHCCCFTSSL